MNNKIQKWLDKNITIDYKGKNIFITGANSGIGFEMAKKMVQFGANVTMLVRNLEKGKLAVEKLKEEYVCASVNIIELDLASKKSIEKCVEKIVNDKLDIDVFINNAGVYHLPKGTTKDGYEITFGTNYLGTLYLNDLLNKYLLTLNHKVINILTTSISVYLTHINYKDFESKSIASPLIIYARSKLAVANLYYTYLDEFKNTNVSFRLIHPGTTYTPLIVKAYKNKVFQKLASIFMKIVFHTPEKASLTSLMAIQSESSKVIAPSGLLQISGFPKTKRFKIDKRFRECTLLGRTLLENNKWNIF